MAESNTAATVRTDKRIELRATEEIKELLSTAAAYTGVDLTSFVLSNVVPVAREIVEQKERLQVSTRDLQAVADLLADPPAPPAALLEIIRGLGKSHGIRTTDAGDRKASRGSRVQMRKN